MDPLSNRVARLGAELALIRARLEVAKAKGGAWNRWPAGSIKGGQFAPKGAAATGGGAADNTFVESGWAGSGMWTKPKAPPPGSKPHPHANDKGQPVTINKPTKASHASTWADHKAVATFIPGGAVPTVLNGVKFSPAKAPQDWSKVSGTLPQLDVDDPFEPKPGKSSGAGVVILEPDGRMWLTKPTNEFGGYANTYPKGTVESGLSMQQNAIKEAFEETGLQVKIVGILGDYERTTSQARFYLAQRVGGSPADMGWESQAIRLAPLAQARKLLNMPVDQDILDDVEHLIELSKIRKTSWAKQPRWPGGSPLGGQWKTTGTDGLTMPPIIAGGLMGSNPMYQSFISKAHAAAQAGNMQAVQEGISKYAPKAAAFAAGTKGSHYKWSAQAHQYLVQLAGDKGQTVRATATADRIAGPMKLSSLTPAGAKPGGSNPGGLYKDPAGATWLVKGNKQLADGVQGLAVSNMRAANEVLAAKLLLAAGVGAPEMKLVDLQGQYGGGMGVASKMETGIEALKTSNAAHVAAAQNDFAVHAWLGNYDALGMGLDNTVISTATGKAINIDPGGALLFRAQGALKDPYTPMNGLKADAPEFETMRQTSSEQIAIYGKMTASQLAASAEKLKSISSEQIVNLVNTYGPGDQKMKDDLAQRLVERKDAILAKAAALQPAPQPRALWRIRRAEPPEQSSQKSIQDSADEGIIAAKAVLEKNIAANPNYVPPSGSQNAKLTIQEFKYDASTGYVQGHAGLADYMDKAWGSKNLQAVALAVVMADQLKKTDPGKASDALVKVGVEKMLALAYEEVIAAKKILDSAPKIEVPDKPVFSSTLKKADQWYAAMADGMQKLHANGDLEGLKAAATGGKYEGGLKWKPTSINGKKIAAYHAGLVASLEQKQAAGVVAGAQAADKALTSTPTTATPQGTSGARPAKADVEPAQSKPSLPNFAAALMAGDTDNAKSSNNKVKAIQKAAEAGDVKGILSLAFGNNTYAKKNVQLANDTLAALGSPHKVQSSQKANAHPALLGGATPAAVAAAAAATGAQAPAPHPAPKETKAATKADIAGASSASGDWIKLGANEKIVEQGEELGVKWAKIEVPAKGFNASSIPTPPDFFSNGTQGPSGKWKSSKEALNAANNAAVQAIYAAATSGKDPGDFSGVKVPEINPSTLQTTGKDISVTALPVAGVKDYIISVRAELEAQLKPTFRTVQSGSMAGGYAAAAVHMAAKYASVKYEDFGKADRAADYVVLSKDAAQKLPVPKLNDMKEMTATSKERLALKKESDARYATLTPSEQGAVKAYTGSAYDTWNSALRQGATEFNAFKSAQTLVTAFKKASVDIPAGTIIWRGLNVGKSTFDSVVGGIIQDGSFNSASYGAHPGGPGEGASTWLRIHVPAKGLKGMDVTTFSNFGSGEREILIQNGVRYAVIKTEKFSNFKDSNGKTHGAKTIVDVIALPHGTW